MIHETLKFLADELNKYLSLKLGATTDIRVVLGNVAKAQDTESGGGGGSSDSTSIVNKAILTLVNVEEDRIAKQQENYVKTDTGVNYKNPPLYVNLYVLISLNRTTYTDNLKWLTYIMQFFQHQVVFTPVSHPKLDEYGIQKLVAELHSLNFEQINHLWSTLGGKYLPSVMYKIRQVTIDENAIITAGGYILEIDVQDRHKHPVS